MLLEKAKPMDLLVADDLTRFVFMNSCNYVWGKHADKEYELRGNPYICCEDERELHFRRYLDFVRAHCHKGCCNCVLSKLY